MSEQHAPEKKRPLELRIVIGTQDKNLSSCIWRIWQGKTNDDIYIAPRPWGRVRFVYPQVKASFHPNRYCYFGFHKPFAKKLVREGHSVPDRAWTSWERP